MPKRENRRVKDVAVDSADDSDSVNEEELIAAGVIKPTSKGQYHKVGLLQSLDDIQRNLAWIETLDVTSKRSVHLDNADDDLKREVEFYNIALDNVKRARAKLDTLGEPHQRPDDYFAEMLKTDTHMQRVKDKLIFEQKKMAAVEQRKREKEQRQYAKQVQAERLKDKAKAKKASQAALKSLTKQKRSRGHMLEDSEVDRIMMGGAGRGGAPDAKKSWRRKRKDSRYGSGGKKRGSKRNDKASTMQGYKDFNSRRNREGTGRAARGGKPNRPGKRRRLAARTGRS